MEEHLASFSDHIFEEHLFERVHAFSDPPCLLVEVKVALEFKQFYFLVFPHTVLVVVHMFPVFAVQFNKVVSDFVPCPQNLKGHRF